MTTEISESLKESILNLCVKYEGVIPIKMISYKLNDQSYFVNLYRDNSKKNVIAKKYIFDNYQITKLKFIPKDLIEKFRDKYGKRATTLYIIYDPAFIRYYNILQITNA
jgi:hypothetical protein